MTQQEAINAANQAAEAEGWNLGSYVAPTARLSAGEWTVFYDSTDPAPVGGFFHVIVNDQTAATRIVPGR